MGASTYFNLRGGQTMGGQLKGVKEKKRKKGKKTWVQQHPKKKR
jgi:hypothetical protein